ncbi:MAG: hypothetical protein R3A13_08700 [Bdellovibrionota bacterium]
MRVRNTSRLNSICMFLILSYALLLLAGCNGNTSSNDEISDDSRNDDIFVAENSGSVSVSTSSDSVGVADTTSFTVEVKGSDGTPQSDVVVICDSEAGLAIIEPNTGRGITDGFGSYSGTLGCAAPGSFRFGCRTQGIGLRELITVKCEGGIPDGFVGFPGAGGGGLGGGVSDVDDEISGDSRISAIAVYDRGTIGTEQSPEIDIGQNTCVDGTETTPEPFFNTFIGLTVVNNSNVAIRFNKMTYQVENTNSGQFNSNEISVIGQAGSTVDPEGGEVEFSAIFAEANAGGKRFIGASSNIAFSGTRNVTFRMTGTSTAGDSVTVSGRLAINFNNFNNCS